MEQSIGEVEQRNWAKIKRDQPLRNSAIYSMSNRYYHQSAKSETVTL
jgi:hypothetical protein